MNSPLVSVVIPTYNYGRYICETVESALGQTYSPIEIIVVDDGSTDDTGERLTAYGNRVRYIYQQNSGPAVARNRGVQDAHGDWIAFLDADDLWLPYRLELQVELLRRLCEPALLCSHTIAFTDQPPSIPAKPSLTSPIELTVHQILFRNYIGTSTVMVPRDVILAVGGFDRRYCGPEDFDLWLRVARRLKVWLMPEALVLYRVLSNSLSNRANRMRAQELQIVRDFSKAHSQVVSAKQERQALACVHFRAGIAYAEARRATDAFCEVVRSVIQWPLSLPEYSPRSRLIRLRLCRRVLRGYGGSSNGKLLGCGSL
jgi:glycosyltransferase involved in cell wall biosynthesis